MDCRDLVREFEDFSTTGKQGGRLLTLLPSCRDLKTEQNAVVQNSDLANPSAPVTLQLPVFNLPHLHIKHTLLSSKNIIFFYLLILPTPLL